MPDMEPHVFMPEAKSSRCKYTNSDLERCDKPREEHFAAALVVPAEQEEAFQKFYADVIVGVQGLDTHSTPGLRRALGMAWQAGWDAALNQGDKCLDPDCQHAASHHEWRYPYAKPHCKKCGRNCNTPEA